MIVWALIQLLAFVTSSSSATCPPAWTIATVRPSGVFACELVRRENHPDRSPFPRRIGRVWCDAGAIAYAADDRTVRCLARRSSS